MSGYLQPSVYWGIPQAPDPLLQVSVRSYAGSKQMEFVNVSAEALASIQRMAAELEADARRWRWCEKHRFPSIYETAEGTVHWYINPPTATGHFATTAAEAVDLAMEAIK